MSLLFIYLFVLYYLFCYILLLLLLNFLERNFTVTLCSDLSDHKRDSSLRSKRCIRSVLGDSNRRDSLTERRAAESDHHEHCRFLCRDKRRAPTRHKADSQLSGAHNSKHRGGGPERDEDRRKAPVDAAGREPEGRDAHSKGVEYGPAQAEIEDFVADAACNNLFEEEHHRPDVHKREEELDGRQHPVGSACRGVDGRPLRHEEKSAQNDADKVGGQEACYSHKNVLP